MINYYILLQVNQLKQDSGGTWRIVFYIWNCRKRSYFGLYWDNFDLRTKEMQTEYICALGPVVSEQKVAHVSLHKNMQN